MNYVDIFNLLNTDHAANTNAYATWYNDDEPMKKSISNTIHSILCSNEKNEIEVKEEKKNGRTESQHPDDGCIYW